MILMCLWIHTKRHSGKLLLNKYFLLYIIWIKIFPPIFFLVGALYASKKYFLVKMILNLSYWHWQKDIWFSFLYISKAHEYFSWSGIRKIDFCQILCIKIRFHSLDFFVSILLSAVFILKSKINQSNLSWDLSFIHTYITLFNFNYNWSLNTK